MSNNSDDGSRWSRYRIPSLFELFFGKLANWIRRIAQWRKQGLLRKALQITRRKSAWFEALEPRLLLSADLVHDTPVGFALDATLKVADNQGGAVLRLLDNLSNAVLGEHAFDQDVSVTVRGNDQSDKLVIGFDRAALAHLIHFYFDGGDGGQDELVGPDRSNAWWIDAPGAGAMDDGIFTGVEHVTGGSQDDTFVVLDPSGTTEVEGGAGNDTLVGPDGTNEWVVSDHDAGTLNLQSFLSIENLHGVAVSVVSGVLSLETARVRHHQHVAVGSIGVSSDIALGVGD